MKRIVQMFLVPSLLIYSMCANADKGVTSSGARSADFNFDGRVDEKDLLDLAPRKGARVGESDRYGFRYDLSGDLVVDSSDIAVLGSQWKWSIPTGEVKHVDEIRHSMGLDVLSGQTWRYRCISGNGDCDGEERTISGGPILKIDDRQVLPIVWGSGEGEPWAEVLMTLDGPLEIVGLRKVGGPEGLPGLSIPFDTSPESTAPIGLSHADMVYAGSPVISLATTSAFLGIDLSPFGGPKGVDAGFWVMTCIIVADMFFCAECDKDCDFCGIWVDQCLNPIAERVLGCPPHSACSYCQEILIKGEEVPPPVLMTGEGILEFGIGSTRGTWEIFSSNGRIVTFNLCWFHGSESKCLTFVSVDDDDPGDPDCVCGPGLCLVEEEDVGGTQEAFAPLPRGYCFYGELPEGDPSDAFRVLPENTETDLYVLIRILEGSGAGVRVYRGSPTPGNLAGSEEIDVHFGDSYYDVPAGVDCWVEIYSTGNAVSYEVRAITLGQ